jgi:ATP-dependent DNA ligase
MIVPEVMLAAAELKRPEEFYAGYVIQEKLDGIRALIIKKGSEVRVFGRNYVLNKQTREGLADPNTAEETFAGLGAKENRVRAEFTQQLPELVSFFQDCKYDVVLDGELMSTDFLTLQTKVRTTTKHVDDPGFYFVAYDLLGLKGPTFVDAEISYGSRIATLQMIHREHKADDPFFRLVKAYGFVKDFKNLTRVLDKVAAAGGEGLVIKDLNSTYKPGKRGQEWVKILPYREMDVVFLSILEGAGKCTGMVGALQTIRKDHVSGDAVKESFLMKQSDCFQVGTGFTEAQRKNIWDLYKKGDLKFPCNGKIKYKELSMYGIPRHPVFLQFKED